MTIEFEKQNGVATVTLNRPDKKNAMLIGMRDRIADIADEINDDDDIRVVILTGAGSDFCAGADVSEMAKGGINGSLFKARHMQKAIKGLGRVQKPMIGAVRGVALGMGLSMALACDYVIATETARFGAVQRKIGLCPDAGNVWFLTRYLGVARAKELVYSARMVGAQEALQIGLVTKLVADDQLLPEALALATSFADAPTLALSMAKRMFDVASTMTLDQFMDFEGSTVPLIAQSEDFKEGTRSFMERRPAKFTGT
ncbi:MAG: enoyl-CoA hydratase/isomerase family protein [Solimonas sp.]